MAFIELDSEANSIDRQIEDLIEVIAADQANPQQQHEFAALSAERVRLMLPPVVAEADRMLRDWRKRA